MVYFGEFGAMKIEINANYIIAKLEEILDKKIKKIDFKSQDSHSQDWADGEIVIHYIEEIEQEYMEEIFDEDKLDCLDDWIINHYDKNIYWDDMLELFID